MLGKIKSSEREHPNKFEHVWHTITFCCDLAHIEFTHIHRGCFVVARTVFFDRQVPIKQSKGTKILTTMEQSITTVASHERHGVWNHEELDCLFNGFKITINNTSKVHTLGHLCRESIGDPFILCFSKEDKPTVLAMMSENIFAIHDTHITMDPDLASCYYIGTVVNV